MNLCIDQGNSRTKIALFEENGRLVKSLMYKSFTSADVERLFQLYSIRDSIISSVVNIEPAIVNALNRLSNRFILLDHLTPTPIVNGYDTPETLGLDRLAAAVGAASLCPKENLLIIDIGTAITYDFVDADGIYHGGNIAPGLRLRFSSLKQMTKKLPLVEAEENELIPLFGKNTRDAIAAGVIRGIAYEVKGYMHSLEKQVPHFRTYLTGGHAAYILNNVKRPIALEKNLVLIGLNGILEYNKK